jgi:hypothetical protein
MPAPFTLQQTKVEVHAKTRVDSARRFFLIVLAFAALLPLGLWFVSLRVPANTFVLFVGLQGGMTVLALIATGYFWYRAHKNLPNYATQTRITWTIGCRDIEHSWDIGGLGPCEGWRDVVVRCVQLPKRGGKMLAMPAMKVMIDNDGQSIAQGKIAPNDKHRHLGRVDKAGKPIRIMLSHDRPEDASDELPWEVEISVQGDPNPPETLTARPLALDAPSSS